MNIKDHHQQDKEVSLISLFKSEISSVISLRLLKGACLQKHFSKSPAMLLCVNGKAEFNYENGQTTQLESGDYQLIEDCFRVFIPENPPEGIIQ